MKLMRTIFFVLLGFLLIELTVRAVDLIAENQIAGSEKMGALAANSAPSNKKWPTYMPHPFFGFTYTPDVDFMEATTRIITNADGFTGALPPQEREKGTCVYGIFGDSVAMGWGVAPERRHPVLLEQLLNAQATTSECRQFKVINFAIGSYITQQATRVFLQYSGVLDGAIFISGNNDLSRSTCAKSGTDPIVFPQPTFWERALSFVNSNHTREINHLSRRLVRVSHWAQEAWLFKNLYSVRALLNGFVSRTEGQIGEIQKMANAELRGKELTQIPRFRLDYLDLREEFKDISEDAFHYSDEAQPRELRPLLFKNLLPVFYGRPMEDVAILAQAKKIKVLSIIAPLPGAVKRLAQWGVPVYRMPVFHREGNKAFNALAQRLKGLGMPVFNFNELPFIYKSTHDPFLDGAHLTDEGNQIFAEGIAQLVRSHWLGSSQGSRHSAL